MWAIGSHPGHDDIIPFAKTTVDCGVSAEDKAIDIHEGHAYFITVKVILLSCDNDMLRILAIYTYSLYKIFHTVCDMMCYMLFTFCLTWTVNG